MRSRVLSLCLVLGVVLVPGVNWAASGDCLLTIDGVEAGSQAVDGDKRAIDLESWSWGGSGTTSGGGTATAVSRYQDFHFVMKLNSASPRLMKAMASGEHFRNAVLDCRTSTAGKKITTLKMRFDDVTVSSYQTGCSSQGPAVPVEQISLNFWGVQMDYWPLNPDGSRGGNTRAEWNLRTNQSSYSGAGAQAGGSPAVQGVSAPIAPAATSPAEAPARTAPAILRPKTIKR